MKAATWAAVGATMLGGQAVAQQNSGGATPAKPPGINAPSPPPQQTTAVKGSFVAERTTGQWLASELRGRSVYDRQTDKIGAVSDLVINPDGRLEALVLAVGGFLGIGQKDVAVPFADIKFGRSGATEIVVVDHTEEQLRDAPAFDAKPKTQ